MHNHWTIVAFQTLLLLGLSSPYIYIVNDHILSQGISPIIFSNNSLNKYFDDAIFQSSLNCRNDNLQMIDNRQNSTNITVYYANLALSQKEQILIKTTPNDNPIPIISSFNASHFVLSFNCIGPFSTRNYWNQVKISLPQNITFSFLLNCDPQNRHKQFQIGYLFLALINAGIIVGVAMHSYAWSIRINLQPLRYQLKWLPFLISSLIGDALVIFLLKFVANKDSEIAFEIIRYSGVVVSIPCFFLCCNQCFYLIKKLQKSVIKFIRWCDLISFAFTVCIGILAVLYENWIFYNIIAGTICVAAIKIFHFDSLKQAYKSMTILFVTVSVLAGVLHFILPQSYNDYAGELSSPFFLQVPDMIENLFKKCSWLPTIDIIIPGVMLSYLRVYDQNKSSRWGGVYTLTGNITFILATIFWIGLQYIWPWSVPFSFVTYPILMLTIFIVAWRRSQWYDLFNGRFLQDLNLVQESNLEESRLSFSQHVQKNGIQDLLIPKDYHDPTNSSIIE